MKVLIIAAWERRCQGDERAKQLPPLTALHLAGLCPPHVTVEVWHEQARPFDPSAGTDADLVAISAITGSATRMYELADRLRAAGVTVVLGGPHVTLLPDEALLHADAIAVGEADRTFPRMIADFERGRLERVYRETAAIDLRELPVPRYDLLEDDFITRCYIQATRGCPFQCSFCTLKALDDGFRVRPVDQVLRDIRAVNGRTWLQNKLVWFWDDNLVGNRAYAKELFERLIPLRKWWWSQATIDIAQDRELVRLAARSGCIAVFIGIETFSQENLTNIKKYQNRVARYRQAIEVLHEHGIAAHSGIIVGLDEDTVDSIRRIPDIVNDLGIDLPFLNILTPFPGTPLHRELEQEGRIERSGWHLYNAVNVVFRPRRMRVDELESTYWAVRRELYALGRCLPRLVKSARHLSLPGYLMSLYLNGRCAIGNLRSADRPLVERDHRIEPLADGPAARGAESGA